MDGLSDAASIIAVIQLSEKVIKYINGVLGAKEDRKRLREQIRACSVILLQLKDGAEDFEENKAWSTTLEALASPLKRLHETLDLAAMMLHSKDNTKEKLKWPFKEKEVQKLIQAIESEKSLLSLALENNSARLTRKIHICSQANSKQLEELKEILISSTQNSQTELQKLDSNLSMIQGGQSNLQSGIANLHQRQNDQEAHEERQAILNWLTIVDYAAEQQDSFSRRQAGTGRWLLDSDLYQAWIHANDRTLFCPGIPGAGKTVLTSIINADLWERFHEYSTVGLAFLFCNFRRQEEQTIETLLASLLKQLSGGQTPLSKHVKDLYDQHGKGQRRPSFKAIVDTLQAVMASYSRVFILVDGLDECRSDNGCRAKLLSEIFSLQKNSKGNLLATSRFIPEITKSFEGAQLMEIRASSEDIRKYLDEQMCRLPGYVQRDTVLQEDIKKGILDSVDGMFLLAKLHFDSLIGKKAAKAVRTALGKLVTGSKAYDSAYEAAMERIEGQVADRVDLAKQVLTWITCARSPLSPLGLQLALSVEIGQLEIDPENCPDIEDIVSACAGLVTVDEESNIIRLVHYTTQEYFNRTQLYWFPDAHAMITDVCTTYLSLDLFAEYHTDWREKSNTENRDVIRRDVEREKKQRSMLYKYASTNWGHHARLAPSSLPQVMSFLQRPANVAMSGELIEFTGYSFARSNTGLHLAAYFGLEIAATALLQSSSDPNVKNSIWETPLMIAAANGHGVVVELLLDSQASVDLRDKQDCTALYHAAVNGQESIVRLLLIHDAAREFDAERRLYWGPLHAAAANGHEAIVKMFLDFNIALDLKDIQGGAPLHYAAKAGHAAVARLLLEAKASVDLRDWLSRTPLHWASKNGDEATVKLLLEAKASVDSRDQDSQTPLHLAAWKGHEAVVKLLLAHNAPVNLGTSEGTPLQLAAEHGHDAVVKLLLEAGADVKYKDKYGKTALLGATKHGHQAVVVRLIESGADVNCPNKDGNSPLIEAAVNGCDAVAELLLLHGADLEHKNNCGRSALSEAAQHGRESMLKLLLGKGAHINLQDRSGHTPVSIAKAQLAKINQWNPFSAVEQRPRDYEACIQLLEEKGAK